MGSRALGRRRVDGIGEASLAGALSRLLQLTCESVVVFDGLGRVLLANDESARLFSAPDGLVGADVRSLFSACDADGEFDVALLPFEPDGSPATCSCRSLAGSGFTARVRCDTVQSPGETYMLVALPAAQSELADLEHQRSLDDLRRANHRLSGALRIVLDTLDADDMGTLFGRVLEEIAQTMEADGTIVYLAEADGFHLRGLSSDLAGERVVRFMPYDRSVEKAALRKGRAVRLRVCAPTGDALRQGRLVRRDVVDEGTREVTSMRSDVLPPFTSFFVVPVWFGGHVIAILEVGWRRVHPMTRDDARLLDSVAHYLSVQLASAISTMRAQRADRLSVLGTSLREELMSASDDGCEGGVLARLDDVMREVADELDAGLGRVGRLPGDGAAVADLPLTGRRRLEGLDGLLAEAGDVPSVVPLDPSEGLGEALGRMGEPCVGALVDLGDLSDERRAYLVLRPNGAEPLDELETEFLARLAEDAHVIALGDEERFQDKRISQALQQGMRSELQHVDGIEAQACYSSATRSAFVGGDFYDLIRLPEGRACVIMGDVSGKGVEAASVSAAVKTALGAYAWEGLSPARMVRSLNEFLLGFSRLETFATLFVGIVDLAAGTITYCSAGHPPALLIGAHGEQISILDVQSGVVGAFHDIAYVDGVAHVRPGEVLLLYTDGTTEARDPSGAFFGEQGLRDMVMREAAADKPFEGFVDRLMDTVDAFTGHTLEDDVALVALRLDGVPAD